MSTSLDDLVKARRKKELEIAAIGQRISESAVPTVVAFVDLTNSTSMKFDGRPEDWLGFVFEFIRVVSEAAKMHGGTVVKRIGDEVMITFSPECNPEKFLQYLSEDIFLADCVYKVAIDFGDAFYFRFEDGYPEDPYGTVVDRCARIAKLATPGNIICTSEYVKKYGNHDDYIEVGEFTLKGLLIGTNIFIKTIYNIDHSEYIRPLLDAINTTSEKIVGFKIMPKKITGSYIRNVDMGGPKPFLARELLSLPKLPYSACELYRMMKNSRNFEELETRVVGYLVEWDVKYSSYRIDRNGLIVIFTKEDDDNSGIIIILCRMPLTMSEVIKEMEKGTNLHVRGVLMSITSKTPTLDYVDISYIG